MSSELERAAKDLEAYPPSPQKEELLRALADLDKSRAESAVKIAQAEAELDATLARINSPERRLVERIGAAIIGLLAIYAVVSGAGAVWTAEFCSIGRRRLSCANGLEAQFQGALAITIGLLIPMAAMAILPRKPPPWARRSAVLLAVLAFGFLLASLVFR